LHPLWDEYLQQRHLWAVASLVRVATRPDGRSWVAVVAVCAASSLPVEAVPAWCGVLVLVPVRRRCPCCVYERKTEMSAAKQYRKKPVIIEAMQLTETNAGEVLAWLKSFGTEVVMRGGPGGGSKGATITIKTLEGNHLMGVWDFGIRGVQDEAYPCKPDIFEATYEAVSDE